MTQNEAQWDRLISLSLDGELTQEQQLEFELLVGENPAFQARLEEFDRIDSYCRNTLIDALDGVEGDHSPGLIAAGPMSARRASRGWWVLPVAAAACLALLVGIWPERDSGEVKVADFGRPMVVPRATQPIVDGAIKQAGHSAGSIDRLIGNNILYVVGDDGNVYVIGQQSVQTARRRGSGSEGYIRQASMDY